MKLKQVQLSPSDRRIFDTLQERTGFLSGITSEDFPECGALGVAICSIACTASALITEWAGADDVPGATAADRRATMRLLALDGQDVTERPDFVPTEPVFRDRPRMGDIAFFNGMAEYLQTIVFLCWTTKHTNYTGPRENFKIAEKEAKTALRELGRWIGKPVTWPSNKRPPAWCRNASNRSDEIFRSLGGHEGVQTDARKTGKTKLPQMPEPATYEPHTVSMGLKSLPFMAYTKGTNGKPGPLVWTVTPTEDYGAACDIGMEYAAHFAQYLKDNPQLSGWNLLGHIVETINFKTEDASHGYWVGFFTFLEGLIAAQAKQIDPFKVSKHRRELTEEVLARSAAEEAADLSDFVTVPTLGRAR